MVGEKGQKGFFPVAVWYGAGKARAPMVLAPLAEKTRKLVRRDLENIKKLGFNSIRYWIDWATAEPEPGKWNLELLDFLFDLAHENGLKVILQLYLESAPNWIALSYPAARFQAQSGDIIDPQSSPGVCLDHPDVREEAEHFMLRVAEIVKDHPSFYAWDVWSEPHTVQWTWLEWLPRGLGWFCYCPYTQERFRRWLERRYGDIQELNKAWYRTYRSWEEIQPPKYVTLSTYCDLIDWQLFCMDKLAEDLRWRVQTIKKVDPHHVISSHAAISSIFTSPLSWYGNPDDWKMAEEVDVWGTSLYPKHVGSMMPLDPVQYRMAIDATRCSARSRGKAFWLGELQGGHGVTGVHFGQPVTSQDVQLWAWSAVARGAKGLCYYAWYPMSCGYESSGFGLVNLDGSITDRAQAAGAVAKCITENMEVFLETEPQEAEVALVYNPLSYVMLTCSRQYSTEILVQSMMGIYRALVEENIPVDFIHINDFGTGDIEKYKLVFLPFSIMMTSKIADGIKQFVRRGGKLVAEFRPGWSDEKGQCSEVIPGFGLHEVFGCRELWVREEKSPSLTIVHEHEAIKGFSPGEQLKGALYAEALELTSDQGTVLAEFSDGSPALVANRYGDGETLLLGTLLGATYAQQDASTPQIRGFLKGLADWAGVSSTVEVAGGREGQLGAHVLKGKDFMLLFCFNYGKEVVTPLLRLPLSEGKYNAYELVRRREISCEYKDGYLALKVELAPHDVWIVKIKKQGRR